jgi:hypothetical protein
MSYAQVLANARSTLSLVTVERHGAPNISGHVLSLNEDGVTIETEEGTKVYIDFTSMRGVANDGWDLETIGG